LIEFIVEFIGRRLEINFFLSILSSICC